MLRILLGLCFLHCGAQATSSSFANEQLITSSADSAHSVYAADINGDSFVDILVASLEDDKVRLFINNGNVNNPSFTEQVITSSADGAFSVYAEDMNGDSFVDILVTALIDGTVRLFLNNGNVDNPFFTERVITSSANQPISVFATDMNGDSFADIMVASKSDDKVLLFVNNGNVNNPTFTEQVITSSADGAHSVYAADLNGDSFVDVLVASLHDDSVRLFLNNGNTSPSFTEQLITSSADGALSAYAADLNGDSFVDILVASFYDDSVRLFLNNGNTSPSFTEQLITSSADGPRSVFATDMDGDSFVDVLVASQTDKKVRLFLNDGNASPSFTEQLITSSADGAVSVYATDMNGDSFVDILVASHGDDKVRLFLSDSTHCESGWISIGDKCFSSPEKTNEKLVGQSGMPPGADDYCQNKFAGSTLMAAATLMTKEEGMEYLASPNGGQPSQPWGYTSTLNNDDVTQIWFTNYGWYVPAPEKTDRWFVCVSGADSSASEMRLFFLSYRCRCCCYSVCCCYPQCLISRCLCIPYL